MNGIKTIYEEPCIQILVCLNENFYRLSEVIVFNMSQKNSISNLSFTSLSSSFNCGGKKNKLFVFPSRNVPLSSVDGGCGLSSGDVQPSTHPPPIHLHTSSTYRQSAKNHIQVSKLKFLTFKKVEDPTHS